MFVMASTATRAQLLQERKDVEVFGRAAAERRAPGALAPDSPAGQTTSAYSQTLTFQNGRELHGTFRARTSDEIFWQRPDASEVLCFPRGEVHAEPVVRLVPNELDEPAPQTRAIKSHSPSQQPPLEPLDLLVFKNGDELSGRMLSATLGGPLRWRTTHGQDVDFQTERIAGVRVGNVVAARETRANAASETMVELRTGERVRGKLLALDGRQLRLEHSLLGTVVLDRTQLWRLYPDAQLGPIDGGRSPGGWRWASPRLQEPAEEALPADGGRWIYIDGTYARRGTPANANMPISKAPGWQHAVDPRLERFEVRLEIAADAQNATGRTYVALLGSGMALCIISNPFEMRWAVAHLKDQSECKWHDVSLSKLRNSGLPRALRLCVDLKTGSCDLLVNGELAARLCTNESERLEKSAYSVRLEPYNASPIFSDLWIGPWNGELPSAARQSASSTLPNGDVMADAPKEWREGTWRFAGDFADFEIPTDKLLIVDFGGAMQPKQTAGRLRLIDGSSLDADAFQWDGHGLTAHCASLGNVRVEASAVSELLFDPAIPRPPLPLGETKTTGQIIARPDGMLQARQ